LYGHMVSAPAVRCGDFVSAGTIIGYVGSTGQSSGPHLHFEIQVNGTAVNPSGTPGIGW
ncbi:MAG: M23 family metallopeptidase, partial [Chloroflexota bacterium]